MSGAVHWTCDESDLAALREGIARVLESEADRLQLHAHLDGKVRLDRLLWEKAAELGWLAVGLPEQHGGLGFGPRGLEILFQELGRQAAPGAFIATLSAAQALADVADEPVLSEWLPRIVQGECQLAVPAQIGRPQRTGCWERRTPRPRWFRSAMGHGAWCRCKARQGSTCGTGRAQCSRPT